MTAVQGDAGRRGWSPLLGWLACMLIAVGVYGVVWWADPGCEDTIANVAWVVTDFFALITALALAIWAAVWHRPVWLLLILPIVGLTLGVLWLFGVILLYSFGFCGELTF